MIVLSKKTPTQTSEDFKFDYSNLYLNYFRLDLDTHTFNLKDAKSFSFYPTQNYFLVCFQHLHYGKNTSAVFYEFDTPLDWNFFLFWNKIAYEREFSHIHTHIVYEENSLFSIGTPWEKTAHELKLGKTMFKHSYYFFNEFTQESLDSTYFFKSTFILSQYMINHKFNFRAMLNTPRVNALSFPLKKTGLEFYLFVGFDSVKHIIESVQKHWNIKINTIPSNSRFFLLKIHYKLATVIKAIRLSTVRFEEERQLRKLTFWKEPTTDKHLDLTQIPSFGLKNLETQREAPNDTPLNITTEEHLKGQTSTYVKNLRLLCKDNIIKFTELEFDQINYQEKLEVAKIYYDWYRFNFRNNKQDLLNIDLRLFYCCYMKKWLLFEEQNMDLLPHEKTLKLSNLDHPLRITKILPESTHIKGFNKHREELKTLPKKYPSKLRLKFFQKKRFSTYINLNNQNSIQDENIDNNHSSLKWCFKNYELNEKGLISLDHEIDNHYTLHRVNRINEIINFANLKVEAKRSDLFNLESQFFIAVKSILELNEYNTEEKQISMELLSIHYEKSFSLDIVKSFVDDTYNLKNKHLKLFYSILNKALPNFIKYIEAARIKPIKQIKYLVTLSDIKIDLIVELKFKLLLYYLSPANLASIAFTFLIKKCGLKGFCEETPTIMELAERLFIFASFTKKINYQSANVYDRHIVEIVKENKQRLLLIDAKDKFEIGKAVLVWLLDSCPKFFFKGHLWTDSQTSVVISLANTFSEYLLDITFNPVILPMIHPPRYIEAPELQNNCGYLTNMYNTFVNKQGILHHNRYCNRESLMSKDVLNTVNYLNKTKFKINSKMLEALHYEWTRENSYILENYNFSYDDLKELKIIKSNLVHDIVNSDVNCDYKEIQIDEDEYGTDYKKNNKRKQDSSNKLRQLKAEKVHNSKHFLYKNIYLLAQLFEGCDIYFPVFMDFRGRVYPLPNFLNYQNGDLARSLLIFSDNDIKHINTDETKNESKSKCLSKPKRKSKPEVVGDNHDLFEGGNEQILIYFANVYGIGGTFKDRISWVKEHFFEMIDLYFNDRDKFTIRYLSKAKEKAQFISCLLALHNKHHSLDDVNTPVLFDATCSGMQHISALTSNLQLAQLVNITSSEPQDLYGYCASLVEAKLNQISSTTVRNKLSKIILNRKLMKLPVMTIPYNIGLRKLTNYLTEYFEINFDPSDKKVSIKTKNLTNKDITTTLNNKTPVKKKERLQSKILKPQFEVSFNVPANLSRTKRRFKLTAKEANIFGLTVFNTIKHLMEPVEKLKIYFRDMLKVFEQIQQPISWITPSGMLVWGSEIKTRSVPVNTRFIKRTRPATLRVPTEQYDYKAINRSIMANFIHSLDASNIHLLIGKIKEMNINKPLGEEINLYTVHDCFASQNKDMPLIETGVRETFGDLYFNRDYLKFLDQSFISQLKGYGVIINTVIKEGEQLRIATLPDLIKTENKYIFIKKGGFEYNIPNLPKYDWDNTRIELLNKIKKAPYFIN